VWADENVTARRVAGGFNNAVYAVEVDGERYACKLCVADERRRAWREYAALRLLHAQKLDIAPRPCPCRAGQGSLWLDESCTTVPFPVVIYRWVSGTPVGSQPSVQQLTALLETFHHMHSLRRDDFEDAGILDAWFHWFDLAPYLVELEGFLARYGSWLAANDPEGQGLRDRLARLVDTCVEALTRSDVELGREEIPLLLCRVDPNLANAIWGEEGRLRWVDWEFSGWGDPALDLAELRWHAALAALDETDHAWLRENYQRPADDLGFGERLAAWDRLLATRWPFMILRLLWTVYNGPDRLRLTEPAVAPTRLRARLVRFIERAERCSTPPLLTAG
jgi:Ser/Thr protein kinase RdoA (MazF antagonist)